VGTPPRTFTYAALVSAMIENFLYNAGSWPQAAELLQTLWTSREPSGPLPAPHAAVSSPAQEVENRVQAFAVQCAESPNPRHPGVFRALAAQAYARAGDVGRYWAWIDEPCARWPATAAARYAGPWDRPTANPVLVINNTHDPATPYEGAVAMAQALARARLLTVDGYGHVTGGIPSACVSTYIDSYFVDGTLPPSGTVCPQDQAPFTPGP
jgi:pimeloyl-ACP methyl ester carboxylesterase